MKTTILLYACFQGLLVGFALLGKMSIWMALIPSFLLMGISSGVMCILLILDFMFNHIDEETPFGWDGDDDKDDDEDCRKDSDQK